MAWPLVSPHISFYVVLIELPLKQSIENLPCIFVKPQFQVILWSDKWNHQISQEKIHCFLQIWKICLDYWAFLSLKGNPFEWIITEVQNPRLFISVQDTGFFALPHVTRKHRSSIFKVEPMIHRGTPQTSPDNNIRFTIPVLWQWSWNKYRRVTDCNSIMKNFISFSSTHVEQGEP